MNRVPAAPLWLHARRRRLGPSQVLSVLSMFTPPIDVMAVATRLGVVWERVQGLPYSGAVQASESPPAAHIWIRAEEFPARQRFTMAHELGHLLQHPLPPGGMMFRDVTFEGSTEEAQANRFAANLLMPLPMLDAADRRLGGNVELLAQLFDVSVAAMEVRLLRLRGVSA